MATVTKKRLTVAEAADQWKRAKREIARLKPQLEEAAAELTEHLSKTRNKTYRGIALVQAPTRLVLDQAKVREYLGKKLHEFQKRINPKPSLTLLDDGDGDE